VNAEAMENASRYEGAGAVEADYPHRRLVGGAACFAIAAPRVPKPIPCDPAADVRSSTSLTDDPLGRRVDVLLAGLVEHLYPVIDMVPLVRTIATIAARIDSGNCPLLEDTKATCVSTSCSQLLGLVLGGYSELTFLIAPVLFFSRCFTY